MNFDNMDSAIQWLQQENSDDTTLSFYYVFIGDEGAKALAKALQTNTSLTRLNLNLNNISDEGAKALANALQTNTSLTTLDLRWNDIGAEGVTALANALKTNSSLTRLDLGNNRIGDEGATALANALQTNTSLTTLDLRWNDIGAESVTALANALQHNFFMTEIWGLDKDTIQIFLERNKQFKSKFETILTPLQAAEQEKDPEQALALYQLIANDLSDAVVNYPPVFVQKQLSIFYLSLGKKYHQCGLIQDELSCFYLAYPDITAKTQLEMMECMLVQLESSPSQLDDLCLLWLLAETLPQSLRKQFPLNVVIRTFNQLSNNMDKLEDAEKLDHTAQENQIHLFGLFHQRKMNNINIQGVLSEQNDMSNIQPTLS